MIFLKRQIIGFLWLFYWVSRLEQQNIHDQFNNLQPRISIFVLLAVVTGQTYELEIDSLVLTSIFH
jgi:hypothetical protein